VAALALALVGLPVYLASRAAGPASGLVIDERGYGVAGAAVFLFSETRAQLVEETRTGAAGEFRLHLDVPDARVLVEPPAGSGLVPAWGPARDGGTDRVGAASTRQAFVLGRGTPLDVEVRDAHGRGLIGAEVRVLDERGAPAVVALATTDGHGRARLLAPARASVGVLGPPPVRLARWRHDIDVRAEEGVVAFTLPPAELVTGRVTDAGGAGLAGIVVVSAEIDAPTPSPTWPTWNGFALSDAAGAFRVPRTTAPTELVALDPHGIHLPQRLELDGPSAPAPTIVLAPGARLEVLVRRAGEPLDARVWSWSPAAGLWGWGARSGTSGSVRLPVSSPYGLRADPLAPARSPLEVWDVPFEECLTVLEAGTTR
jgi:hypothetical protein